MSDADYRLCDVCNCKAFYDSNLNYEFVKAADGVVDLRLDNLGDWVVLCTDCATTHTITVTKKNTTRPTTAPTTGAPHD